MSWMKDASAYAQSIPIRGRGVEALAEAMFDAQGEYFMDGLGLGPGVSWVHASKEVKDSWREVAKKRLNANKL